MAKKRKQERLKPWCWYCDREFEDEKVLIQHQRMKHFKCSICHRKLNSASGLVIHMAQLHKITMEKVPNAVEGHDTPELEIFGMDGVPQDDLQRHIDGLPIVPYNKTKMILGDSSILPLLAAQKVSVATQLAESKSLIVQGTTTTTTAAATTAKAKALPQPIASAATATASTAVAAPLPPQPPVVSPPATAANVIVSPPSASTTSVPLAAPPIPAAPAMPAAYPQGQNPYYAANPYYQHYYAQQYAAYYQQYYAQQQAQQYSQPGSAGPGHFEQQQQQQQVNANHDQQANTERSEATEQAEPEPEPMEENPLEAATETSIVVPPVVDEVSNRVVPGMIFTVPCIDRSIEELRSRLRKYTPK